jgi:hypothetical protein
MGVLSVTSRPHFSPGERTLGTHCTGGWVGPRAGLDTEARGKISLPLPGNELGPRCRLVRILTEIPGSLYTTRQGATSQKTRARSQNLKSHQECCWCPVSVTWSCGLWLTVIPLPQPEVLDPGSVIHVVVVSCYVTGLMGHQWTH